MPHRTRTRFLTLALVAAVCATLTGCRKQDVRTVIVRCPQMKSQACADLIVEALNETSYGVRMDSIRTDLASRTIELDYDSMLLSLKNIEFVIAKAGFAANEVPADTVAAAALPEECR